MSDETPKLDVTTAPNDKITISIDGEEKELFMSYGLLTNLAQVIDNPELAAGVSLNPEVLRTMCAIALVPRSESGAVLVKTDAEISEILDGLSPSSGEELIEWVQEHLIAFFMKGVTRSVEMVQAMELATNQEKLQAALKSGSLDSAS